MCRSSFNSDNIVIESAVGFEVVHAAVLMEMRRSRQRDLRSPWATVYPLFEMCVGWWSRAGERWSFVQKMLPLLFPLLSEISYMLICAEPRFLWHHRTIRNASRCQDAGTQVPTCGFPQTSVPSSLFSRIVTAPEGSRLPGRRKSQRKPSVSVSSAWHRLSRIIPWSCTLHLDCINHSFPKGNFSVTSYILSTSPHLQTPCRFKYPTAVAAKPQRALLYYGAWC